MGVKLPPKMRRARGAARVGSVRAHYAGAGSLKKGTRRTRGREIRQRRRAGGSRDIFCETPAAGLWSRRRLFWGWGVPEASPEGWSGRFRRNDELLERRPRGPSRGPRPLRRLLRALRRPTGPFAEESSVLGTFPLKPKRAQKRSPGGARCPLPDVGQGCLAGGCAGAASPSARLLSRGEADLPSAAA